MTTSRCGTVQPCDGSSEALLSTVWNTLASTLHHGWTVMRHTQLCVKARAVFMRATELCRSFSTPPIAIASYC